MKILIIKRDKLGDLLLTSPLIAALRQHFAGAQIDLLASEYSAWAAIGNPHLDLVLSYPRVRVGRRVSLIAAWAQLSQLRRLRAARYDVAIAAQGEDSPRAAQRAILGTAKRPIAFADPLHRYGRRLSDALPPPQLGHEARRMLALLTPLGIEASFKNEAPSFVLPAEASAYATQWLAKHALSHGSYVVLGLGARRARRQPTANQIRTWVTALKREFGLDT